LTQLGSVVGVTLSEPHIDEFAVEFVYIIYIYVSPLWQPSMGNVGNAGPMEYNNNWISPSVQRSLPL